MGTLIPLDASKPDDCTFAADLDDYIRENRDKINEIITAVDTSCITEELAAGDNVIDAAQATRVVVTNAYGVQASTIKEINNGYPGRVLNITVDPTADGTVTLAHDGVNIFLDNDRDYVMRESDNVTLIWCEFEVVKAWAEIARTPAVNHDGVRFWPSIDKYGALTTEVL